MPTFIGKSTLGPQPREARTIVLTEDANGRRAAYVIPQGPAPQINSEAGSEEYRFDFGMPAYRMPTYRRTTMEIELGEHKVLAGEGPTGEHGPMANLIGAAMAVIDDKLAALEEEAKQKRRLEKAIAALEGEGVGPKKARRLAEAALYAADRVK